MTDTYRVVLLDANGREVGVIESFSFHPNDTLVVMPEPGAMFPLAMQAGIGEALTRAGVRALIFQVPVQLARLEKT